MVRDERMLKRTRSFIVSVKRRRALTSCLLHLPPRAFPDFLLSKHEQSTTSQIFLDVQPDLSRRGPADNTEKEGWECEEIGFHRPFF